MVSDDGVDPVRPGRPAAGLHGPDPLDLARGPDHGQAGLGRQVVAAQVELGQGHRLVVEAAGRGDDLLGRGGHGGDALPRLVGIVARAWTRGRRRCRRRPAAASSMAVTTPPSWASSARAPARTAYCADHRAEAVAGRPAGELPVGVGRVGLRPPPAPRPLRPSASTAATAPRSAARRGGRSPSTASSRCTSSPARAGRCPR